MLSKYKNDPIKIVLPLVYGDYKYILEVKKAALELFEKQKIEIWEKRTSLLDYMNRIAEADLCVYSSRWSTGLGNIAISTFLRRKICLNEDGVIAQAFSEKGVKVNSINEIGSLSLEEIRNMEIQDDDKLCWFSIQPPSQIALEWSNALNWAVSGDTIYHMPSRCNK